MDLTGNRMFGMPPRIATYLCLWDIRIGQVKSIVTQAEANILGAAAQAFRHNFTDPANAPADEYVIHLEPDGGVLPMFFIRLILVAVTFLSVAIASMDLSCCNDGACFQLAVPQGIVLKRNNAAGKSYSNVTSIRVPAITARALVCLRTQSPTWLEAASLAFDANLDMYFAPDDLKHRFRAQQENFTAQDASTHRGAFLYHPDREHSLHLPRFC